MKVMKKVLSLMLAVAMMAGMWGTTAMAAETSSIIIDSGDEAGIDMRNREFKLYKIFEAASVANAGIQYDWILDGEGNKLFYDFFFVQNFNGNKPRVEVPVNGTEIDAVIRYINSLTTAVDINTFSNNLLAYIKAAGSGISAEAVPSEKIVKTQARVTYQDLPMGYYLIEDVTTGEDVLASVMLTTTSSTEIHLKATKPTIEKYIYAVNGVKVNEEGKAKGVSVSVGDTVTYRISIMIPDVSTYLKGYFFQFYEELPDALTLDTDSDVIVQADGKTVNRFTTKASNRANYAMIPDTFDSFKTAFTGTNAENVQFANLVLSTVYGPNHGKTAAGVTESELSTIYALFNNGGILFDLYESEVYPAGEELELFYTAKVNEGILEETVVTNGLATQLYSVDNVAMLRYTTDPNNPTTNIGSVTSSAIANTHHFIITKMAAETTGEVGTKQLSGATFMIYKGNDDGSGNISYEAEAMKFVQTVSGNNFTYSVPSESQLASSELTDQLVNNNGTSDSDGAKGYVDIYGLGTGYYKLVEIVSPDGYRVPAEPFYFTISATHSTAGFLTHLNFNASTANDPEVIESAALDLANNRIRCTVTNIPSAALPTTGGMGTTLFTIAGILLMGGAVAYLVVSRKRRVNEK